MREGLVFAALIERVTGIVLPEWEFARLGEIARERAETLGLEDSSAYLQLLRRERDSREWRYLLQRITIKESSLFRGPAQFAALCDEIIPERIAAGRDELRIWSAGCARGEEPATLAVCLAECKIPSGIRTRIFATDVDREAMAQGMRAEFSARAVRRLPEELLARYFTHENSQYRLQKQRVPEIEFSYFNLVDIPFPQEWRDFDVIFLRNVLIYFRESVLVEVIGAVTASLAEGGYLFVGPSESLWSIDSGLSRRSFSNCFAYRKHAPDSEIERSRYVPKLKLDLPIVVQKISVESEGKTDFSRPSGGSAPKSKSESRLVREIVFEISIGRFDLAHQLLEESEMDPIDARLRALEGILYRCEGRKEEAVRSFRAALYLNENLYQVRYLLAVCLSDVGWTERAKEEFKTVLEMLSIGRGEEIPEFAPLDIPGYLTLQQLCKEGLAALQDPELTSAFSAPNESE